METDHYDDAGRQKVRVWQPVTVNVRATKALSTGNNDVDITLPADKIVNRVSINVGAVTGVPVMSLYSGSVAAGTLLADNAGNAIANQVYILTQSADAFKVGKSSGTVLGVRIAGLASGSGTAYINVECV
jgi:hypothetical protein